MIAKLGHLAVWAAVYVTAAVVCAAQLAGASAALSPDVLLFAWSTALLAYLLDRVKLRDAWLDPADRQAHPARYAFLVPRRRGTRLLMAAAGACSVVSGWMLHPLAVLATGATILGVLAYAGRPRAVGGRARLKDRFIFKNAFVGGGIGAFSILAVVLAVARAGSSAAGRAGLVEIIALASGQALLWGLVFVHVALRAYADAVLCDIDDEPADRAHDTRTLPTRLGGERAWLVAMGLRLVLAASLLVWPAGPWAPRAAWAIVTAVTTAGLWFVHPLRVRDVVDARFGVEAACVFVTLKFLM